MLSAVTFPTWPTITSFESTRQNRLFFRIPTLLFSCQQFHYIFAFHYNLLFWTQVVPSMVSMLEGILLNRPSCLLNNRHHRLLQNEFWRP
ncbi:hypothetical protein HanXRQr2_Chr06g0261941 [Helianthus annuus]|uniref:Uncharacterized protein n=1 Tax=Helianthus annuus TaxID=4232 RepID=A0A9K3IT62_HELAN|nr:hypothetical protein HanXRQr2_Chr06g0261941 [Helianthus annuus]KAJ0567155.1 hypothetical protein HanIR_Chr06g0281571 [Helianthus annuus]KAJ0915681.1 hypothetical protein HanPSC8_Chr06g0252661 [Helianthus annuus]